jgi:ribosome modulation factor
MNQANKDQSNEWHEGYQAFIEGEAKKSPYPDDKAKTAEWLSGYAKAKSDQALLKKLRKSEPFATINFSKTVDIVNGEVRNVE